jgi:hypothetical protein
MTGVTEQKTVPVVFFGSSREQRRLIARTLNALDGAEALIEGSLDRFTATTWSICSLGHEARETGYTRLGDAMMRLVGALLVRFIDDVQPLTFSTTAVSYSKRDIEAAVARGRLSPMLRADVNAAAVQQHLAQVGEVLLDVYLNGSDALRGSNPLPGARRNHT